MLQLKMIHSQVLCILQCVENRGHTPVQPCQEGSIWSNGRISPRCTANNNCKKWCSHPHHGPWYEPAVSSCHGNNCGTQHQEHAVKKIITQVHMATTGPNAHDINPALYCATLLSPSQFHSALPNESTFLVIWDMGASISVSHDKCNFVGPLKKPGFARQLKGITKGLQIEGEGHVMWAMHDTDGMLQLIKIPAFYIPKCKIRLLSMMSLLQTYKDEKIEIHETMLTLSGIPSEPTKGTVIMRVNPMNNLPTSLSY